MKKTAIAFVLMVFWLMNIVSFAYAEEFSFRNGITFGMTAEEVIDAEGIEPHPMSDELWLFFFDVKVAGKNATLTYNFEDDSLYKLRISFVESYIDPNVVIDDNYEHHNLYLDDFDYVEKTLEAKYGKATLENFYDWSYDFHEYFYYLRVEESVENAKKIGYEVASGNLCIYSIWDFGDCFITHEVYGSDYEIQHAITYSLEKPLQKVDISGV